MHKMIMTASGVTLLIVYSLLALSGANASQKQTSVNADYSAYLCTLDSSSPNAIVQARSELLSRFRGKEDMAANDSFRAFSKFYTDVISVLESGFSSKSNLQEVLSMIAERTGLDDNPFPAFDKLDTAPARDIKKKYSAALNELHHYTNAGLNFGQAEGMWYLQSDPDFLKEAASVTTGDLKEYLRFNAEECKQKFTEDGGILIPWDDLRKKIIHEEDFAKQHPNLPEVDKNLKDSISWMINVYLAGIENSSIDNHGEHLTTEVKNSYETFLKENTTSQYYNIVKDAYAIWAKNNYETSWGLIDYLKKKDHGQFTYMLEKGLSRNRLGNVPAPHFQSRTAGSVTDPTAKMTGITAIPAKTEESMSFTYRLIIAAASFILILILLRMRSKAKKD